MAKGNLKEGRKEIKKAKKYEGHRAQKSVAMARKFSQSETLPKGQKRARDSDGENCQRDISSKEGKKIKKETVVERTEEYNSTTDNCQSKGEQKERVSKGKLKPVKEHKNPQAQKKVNSEILAKSSSLVSEKKTSLGKTAIKKVSTKRNERKIHVVMTIIRLKMKRNARIGKIPKANMIKN